MEEAIGCINFVPLLTEMMNTVLRRSGCKIIAVCFTFKNIKHTLLLRKSFLVVIYLYSVYNINLSSTTQISLYQYR
jgi:hypothetical protein